jgi:hypothetical protein
VHMYAHMRRRITFTCMHGKYPVALGGWFLSAGNHRVVSIVKLNWWDRGAPMGGRSGHVERDRDR